MALGRPIQLEPAETLLELARVGWIDGKGQRGEDRARREGLDEPKLRSSRMRTTRTPGTSSSASGFSARPAPHQLPYV